jgi:hypothetical protein
VQIFAEQLHGVASSAHFKIQPIIGAEFPFGHAFLKSG